MNTVQYNHLFSFIWNQCNTDLFQIVINMMAEHTEFARNYLDNETFRNFVNTRVFQQARTMV